MVKRHTEQVGTKAFSTLLFSAPDDDDIFSEFKPRGDSDAQIMIILLL